MRSAHAATPARTDPRRAPPTATAPPPRHHHRRPRPRPGRRHRPLPTAHPSTATPGPTATPTATAPASPDGNLRRGQSGPAVRDLQQRLDELGYWTGKSDGVFGNLTEQAVYAVQKTAGLRPDGVVGPKTRAALAEGTRPDAQSTKGHVAEVDLDRQLLMIVDDGSVSRIFNTSTGTFEEYTHDGETYLADTPRGKWAVGWQVDGWRDGPLGRLYRPKYFHHQGIAVHGYTSVPPQPASHGCVRVTLPAMDWLWARDQLPLDTPVWVY
ncbi:peptidoglycan-binding protein [Micromonospora sp. Llam7]|uniref:L,D-transpeptidase family protein n=1 Tax=Micromonospora tarapacensis TaxID=2835305 RepID=UPI001C832018|nr:L,D-transpeptidase family protein [Micromonospora tarapacensis]MBX7266576.1 peptidoglycan-binding protein [Micromonospora tarapacensis]